MFTTLSILALASTAYSRDYKEPIKHARQHAEKKLKNALRDHSVASVKKHRALNADNEKNTRDLRFTDDFKRGGFYTMELYFENGCNGTPWMQASFPIKKEMGCNNDDGDSMMFTSCSVDPVSNLINMQFDWYDTPACNGMSGSSNSHEMFFGDGPATQGQCMDFMGYHVKFSCHEGAGNAIFAKSGILTKEYDRWIDCENNEDPNTFSLMPNNACLNIGLFNDGDDDWGSINSVQPSCHNGKAYYNIYTSNDCTDGHVFTFPENLDRGCPDGYEREKCVESGYLVRSQYYKDDLNTQKAMALEKCMMTSDTTSMMNGHLGKNGTHFKYEVAEFDNNMCNGTPVNTWWEAVPYEAQDDDMLEGTHYMNRYWYAHTLKEALDLNLLKVWGNDAWNDWWTWELYPNDQCMGEPHSTIAGKQLCNAGRTYKCWDDRLESQYYDDAVCSTPNGSPMVIHRDECKMIDDGIYAKANCYFKGQNYWKPMEHHMTGMH
eukprot:TRINITY_DN62669_c0_g1_i2.p1 TRINITY_DN62669_c0_g1~~TRINITY_DN62669_c0_g1_i2.p1  ORF type:complete len:491 (+),score=3.67 TRINITY_DN62669_c0_g1_i2:138-1610(+)